MENLRSTCSHTKVRYYMFGLYYLAHTQSCMHTHTRKKNSMTVFSLQFKTNYEK